MNRSHNIVIIDDNKDYLFAMETFLSRNGFNVMTATDGKEGFALVQTQKPDLVLLDVMMESLFSGFEVYRQMKLDPEAQNAYYYSNYRVQHFLGRHLTQAIHCSNQIHNQTH